ncbi:hypothetical protein PINS_up014977 [Pythium insidiosum]|nr:hypothetical protein PINS_up014977 [Pythium insidiosum]
MGDSKYAFRSGATSGSGGGSSTSGQSAGRSPWHAMDLHTTTTSSSLMRRAVHMSAVAGSGSGSGTASALSAGVSGSSAQQSSTLKPKPRNTEDSALSARNLLLRHKLSERKRFDSADYAMKKVRQVMDASSSPQDDTPPPLSTASAPATAGLSASATTQAMATTASTSSTSSVGASVFLGALKDDGDVDMATPRDDTISSRATATATAAAAATATTRRYGALKPKPSATDMSALSARNVVLQRQLHERKQFDSADYQLASFKRNAKTASPPPDVDMASPTDPAEADVAAVNSPSATSRTVQLLADEQTMSPSGSPLRSTTSVAAAAVVNEARQQKASKYVGLSGADEVLRRKLAEKKRFDSADYNMAAAVSMAAAQASSRMQPKHQFFPAAASPRDLRASVLTSNALQPPPAPLQTPLAVATAGGNASGYGKLCAANVLIRKKLKERKRFDSADYCMARAGVETDMEVCDMAAGDGGTGIPVSTTPLAGRTPGMAKYGTMYAMNPQAKHMKLSDGSGTRWVAPILSSATDALPRYPFATSDSTGADQDHRLAARNIIIRRKLAERKRFDSADYFVAKKAAEQHEV